MEHLSNRTQKHVHKLYSVCEDNWEYRKIIPKCVNCIIYIHPTQYIVFYMKTHKLPNYVTILHIINGSVHIILNTGTQKCTSILSFLQQQNSKFKSANISRKIMEQEFSCNMHI